MARDGNVGSTALQRDMSVPSPAGVRHRREGPNRPRRQQLGHLSSDLLQDQL